MNFRAKTGNESTLKKKNLYFAYAPRPGLTLGLGHAIKCNALELSEEKRPLTAIVAEVSIYTHSPSLSSLRSRAISSLSIL
jgi:hypothetical protein